MKTTMSALGWMAGGWALSLLLGAAAFQGLELPFAAGAASDGALLALTNEGAGAAVAGHSEPNGTHGTLGGGYGVEGATDSTAAGEVGVYGHSGPGGQSGLSPGLAAGVWGESDRGFGVVGSSNNISVFGWSDRGTALDGFSARGTAVMAITRTGTLIVADSIDENNRPTRRFTVEGDGDVIASGEIRSGGADLADLLHAVPGAAPGDVLAVNEDGLLAPSTSAYQANVVGVHSTAPGFVGRAGDAGVLAPLALAGIVPVKVTHDNGPIRPGDLLVASSRPGHAMRAGAAAPAGTVIGKALAAFDAPSGTVTMLVMLR